MKPMKPVTITIKTTQELDGSRDAMELITDGTLETDPAWVRLTYAEPTPEGSTLTTTITAHLTQSPVRVDLDRAGDSDSRMTVQQGKRHHSVYNMGPFEFALGVYGELVDCRLNEQGGSLRMRYTLDINATYAGRNTVDLSVTRT